MSVDQALDRTLADRGFGPRQSKQVLSAWGRLDCLHNSHYTVFGDGSLSLGWMMFGTARREDVTLAQAEAVGFIGKLKADKAGVDAAREFLDGRADSVKQTLASEAKALHAQEAGA